MTTDSFLFRDCTSGVLGHHGDQLGKGSCNPLLVFQLKVLWYQDFTGTFIHESLHYITMLFSRTVSHIPRMCFSEIHVKINITMHSAARAMGAMTLRISELCLSFSPHPNISDGNVNLVHHFFCIQIFQINGKGPS